MFHLEDLSVVLSEDATYSLNPQGETRLPVLHLHGNYYKDNNASNISIQFLSDAQLKKLADAITRYLHIPSEVR
jgi:hypothetical protein